MRVVWGTAGEGEVVRKMRKVGGEGERLDWWWCGSGREVWGRVGGV